MDRSAKTKLINDIENRLDDFFGEQNEITSSSETRHSIEKLKSAVLSIDWEITDACLSDLINETVALLPQFKNDPMAHALLRMLGSLGRYIRKRKAQAHHEAIKRVMSVFASLEMLTEESRLDENQRSRIVAKEIQAFKKLKEQIELQGSSTAAPVAKEKSRVEQDPSAVAEHERFKAAMLKMEERLNLEVNTLKSQLAALQQKIEELRKA